MNVQSVAGKLSRKGRVNCSFWTASSDLVNRTFTSRQTERGTRANSSMMS